MGRRRGRLLGRPRRLLRPLRGRLPPPLLDRAAIQPNDRVLDVGCGTGQTTRDAARIAHAGSALGVDLSSRMLDHAAAGLPRRASPTRRSPRPTRRSIPSTPRRSTWPSAAPRRCSSATTSQRSATSGARCVRADDCVLVTWQPLAGNEWLRAISPALAAGRDLPPPPPDAGPFALSDPDRVRGLLTEAGFTAIGLDGMSATCGSAMTPTMPIGSPSVSWAGCSRDSTTPAGLGPSMRSTTRWQPTRPLDGVLFGSAAWFVEATRPSEPMLRRHSRRRAGVDRWQGCLRATRGRGPRGLHERPCRGGVVLFAGPLAGSEQGRVRALVIVDTDDEHRRPRTPRRGPLGAGPPNRHHQRRTVEPLRRRRPDGRRQLGGGNQPPRAPASRSRWPPPQGAVLTDWAKGMKFNARKASLAPPGVTGIARVGKPTSTLLPRLRPGDIAVVDHVDLDRDTRPRSSRQGSAWSSTPPR